MRRFIQLTTICLIPIIMFANCKKKEEIKDEIRIAKINTLPINDITSDGATSGGNIIDASGGEITLRGIVWSTIPQPTIDQYTGITIDGTGAGVFTSYLTGLSAHTTYYVKAYALNSAGYAYGNQVDFKSSSYPNGTVHCSGSPTEIVDVTNPITGNTWMDRNLGASRAATSLNDNQAYGDLYQWGRGPFGHQCRTSPTTATLSSTDQPAHGNFILASSSPYDWRSPQNTNLWQGVNGVNNPCPMGYRLPTETELNDELLSWSSNNSAGAIASPLKLPMSGFRVHNSGSSLIIAVGTNGAYQSSTVSGTNSIFLHFSNSFATMNATSRANGKSVRCFKD